MKQRTWMIILVMLALCSCDMLTVEQQDPAEAGLIGGVLGASTARQGVQGETGPSGTDGTDGTAGTNGTNRTMVFGMCQSSTVTYINSGWCNLSSISVHDTEYRSVMSAGKLTALRMRPSFNTLDAAVTLTFQKNGVNTVWTGTWAAGNTDEVTNSNEITLAANDGLAIRTSAAATTGNLYIVYSFVYTLD